MFLHRLEVQGFKSFVDKTELQFGDGITGVIGPNGCGKTNVSDAIRWVMGEQSARTLRGDSMEDVIFNGCPTRKPLGLAEVHLTFKNDRGILPTEYSEVTVSRRVFRSGVSEYFLNKTPCRLKDIRDLFFDTGMGSHAYSVIERSMVDHVLSDNSGHRRFLFEEASGITKYKARKKEALNKLDATEGDLTRLNDIVFEIERELRSLARQVGKARKHQRLRDEIRDLDLKLTASAVRALRERETTSRDEWQEEAVRREGVTAALDQLEASLADRKLALLEIERELSTAQGGLRDREEARGKAEHQVTLLRERAAGLLRRAEEAFREQAALRERLEEARTRETQATGRLAELREQRAAVQAEDERCEAELSQVEAELRARRSTAGERKQLSLDLFSAEAEKRGMVERLGSRHTTLAERRDAAGARLGELEGRVRALAERSATLEARRQEVEAELSSATGELAATDAGLADLAGELAASAATLARMREESAAVESRLATLLELKRNFDGVSEGVRALLGDGRPAGVLGIVSDVLEVPAAQLDALEASLGEAAAFVLVEDHAALEGCLERLRALDSGRATLIDLSALTASPAHEAPRGAGVVGRASELVRCDQRYGPLVERLLGSVVVVDDRAAAARLAAQSESGLRFVSLDGEVWERGRVRAGSVRNLSGLLHRESEIRTLSGALAERALAVEAAEAERAACEARRAQALERRAASQHEVDARRAAVTAAAHELEGAARERAWAEDQAAERRREIAAVSAELDTLARARTEADTDLAQYQTELEHARAQLADLDGAVRALEARHDQAAARAQQARGRRLAMAGEEGEWQSAWARAEQTRRELEAGIAGRIEEERAARAHVAEIEAEVSGLEAGLTGLLETEADQRARVVALQRRFGAARDEVKAGEDDARQRRFEHTELAERLHQLELDRVQARAELDRTFERLRSEYQMDPDGWTPEPEPEGFDAGAAQRELESLRERYRGLGPVNLLALDEYAKKKERWQFLTQQRQDLVSAKAQLLEAIDKINVTASQLFSETFEKVQVHFRDIFKTLFEGGDAELRLTGEDPLEAEIEIAAKPRGKHLQSISLMSGGERALTAIALLFAIYLVKPSPFCLLDEVDAPLDDANVDRFIRMLKRFADRTQFVVITHNKKSMEAAACLYGVTMQELGVSKLVSVRFDGELATPDGAGTARGERNGHGTPELVTS
ncbi:MAG TPA: chromosome segregation protein SMC [Candidatus Eisenbacteria bacterium]|nr:chromosome segregation protein SMC [Candidatus Eisenbacteria bacterium]